MSRYRMVAAAIIPILVLTACTARPVRLPSSPRFRRPLPRPHPRPAASAEPQPAAASPGTKFTGISVNILTFNGPQVAEPLQRRAPDWEQLTGGHVNVVAVGFQTIYDKALLDASTGTNSFDGYVFDPQWLGDFVGPGYLLDLTRSREGRRSSTGRTSARSSATSTRRTTARSTRSRSMATSTWSITGPTC